MGLILFPHSTVEEQDHVVIDQRHSTLQTRRHGVVGLQQGPPELAWAARSECILQERRGSTHKQPQCKPWTCPHTWGQLIEPDRLKAIVTAADAGDGVNWARASDFWPICTSIMQSNARSPEFRRFRLFQGDLGFSPKVLFISLPVTTKIFSTIIHVLVLYSTLHTA